MDYTENSDDEEEFEDGLDFDNIEVNLIPAVPVHTREGSPVDLEYPPLSDNVDEILEDVNYKLGDHCQAEEEVEELTDLLEVTNTGLGDKKEISTTEEVFAFNFKVAADNNEVDMPNQAQVQVPVNFDAEDKEDGEKAQDQAATSRSSSHLVILNFGLLNSKTRWKWQVWASNG